MSKLSNNFQSAHSRIEWIDALRAIPMIFVVLVHSASKCNNYFVYNVFVAPIMLPLFFAISGYLFKVKDDNYLKFYGGLMRKLVIPWLFFSTIWLQFMRVPFEGFYPYFTSRLYKLVTGTLWYLPYYILVEIIQFTIQRKVKKPVAVIGINIGLCAVGCALSFVKASWVLYLSKLLIIQLYFTIGYILRHHEALLDKTKWWHIICAVVTYVVLGLVSLYVFPGEFPSINRNVYPNLVLFFAMTVLGIVALFAIARRIKRIPRLVSFIGQNTLFCYGSHGFFMSLISIGLKFINVNVPVNWGTAILKTLFVLFVCGVGAVFTNKYLPEIVGKRRKKKEFSNKS